VLVAAAEVVAGAAELGVGAGAGAGAGGALVGVYRLVGGAVVVGALVAVVNGGAGGAVVGLALGGAGGAGAGADVGVAGAGCSFWLAPPTRTAVATMIMNATTMATPINVRPPSVLNHFVVPGFGSVSVINTSASLAHHGIVRCPPDGRDSRRTPDEARIHRSSHDGYQHLSRPGRIRRKSSSRQRRHHRRTDLVIAAAIKRTRSSRSITPAGHRGDVDAGGSGGKWRAESGSYAV
jgi:hypothetical protein